MVDRERMLNVRVAEAEMTMLRDLAEHMGLSQSDVVRQLIRNAHAELFTPPRPKRAKTRPTK